MPAPEGGARGEGGAPLPSGGAGCSDTIDVDPTSDPEPTRESSRLPEPNRESSHAPHHEYLVCPTGSPEQPP